MKCAALAVPLAVGLRSRARARVCVCVCVCARARAWGGLAHGGRLSFFPFFRCMYRISRGFQWFENIVFLREGVFSGGGRSLARCRTFCRAGNTRDCFSPLALRTRVQFFSSTKP